MHWFIFVFQGFNKNLKQLELSGNQLHCTCELAWIWEWLREYEYQNECNEVPCDDAYLQDLREVKCINMDYKSILNVFKKDLDCFSSSASDVLKEKQGMLLFLTLIFNLIILM